MYPRNAASPERIAIGAVVQISDGAVQTSGVSVKVRPQGGSASAGGGTIAYEEGVVLYTPTQAETDYTSFALIAYKTACLPATITVVTSASAVAGTALLAAVTHTGAVIPTVTALTGHTPQTGDTFARLGAPAGASVSADVAAVKTQTAAIEVDTQDIQTRLPAALVSGRIDASVGAMAANTITASAVAADAVTELQSGLATAAALATVSGFVDTEVAAIKAKTDLIPAAPAAVGDIPAVATVASAVRTELTTELGRIDVAVSSVAGLNAAGVRSAVGLAAANLDTQIATLATATNLATVAGYLDTEINAIKAKTDNLPASPAAVGDIPTAAAIADQVWDEVIAGHATVGSTGAALAAAGGSGDPWATALPGAYGAGTAGQIVGDYLDVAVSSVGGGGGGGLDAAGVRAAIGLATANLDTQLSTIDTVVDAILVDTAVIGAAGAGLTALPWNAAWDAEVQSEVADALAVYDPPTNTELEARTLVAANYATATAVSDLPTIAELAAGLAVIPTAAANASAVRTNLTTELGRIDVAVSSRSTYAGADTAGTTTLLSRVTGTVPTVAAFEARTLVAANYATAAALATVDGILDKFDTMVQLDGAVYRFTINALEQAPAGGGGGGSGASVDDILSADPTTYTGDTVGAAIARLIEVPGSGPVDPVPAAPADVGVCRVYGYLETPDNRPACNVLLKFTLVAPGITFSERMVAGRTVTATTNSAGAITTRAGTWVDLQRNDVLDAAETTYWTVTCEALDIADVRIDLTAPTADLKALLA